MTKKSELTRTRLLEAAARVASRAGCGALTLESVAAEASTSKGGLLYHFASKELLVAGMVERMTNSFESAREACMGGDRLEPGSWTRSLVRASCDESEEDIEIASCLIAAVALNPELLTPLRERYDQWMKALELDGLPIADAYIVRLAVDGLWLCRLLGLGIPSPAQQEQVKERLLELAGGNALKADEKR